MSLSSEEVLYRDTYCQPDLGFQREIEQAIGASFTRVAENLVDQGMVTLTKLFTPDAVSNMQREFGALMCLKEPDNHAHIQFGGAADEEFLQTAEALSSAVATPLVWALGAHAWGRDPMLSYVRAYRIEPIEPCAYRAFQPHDDGHDKEFKAMLLLTDVDEDGQCMLYWPGTHKIERETRSSWDTLYDPNQLRSLGEPVPCIGKAGTIILFNTKGVHSGQRNLSSRRDTLVFNVTGGKRLYPVPRLHRTVIDKMDPYLSAVLRIGSEKELLETDSHLPEPLSSEHRRQFFVARKSVVEAQAAAIDDGSFDLNIVLEKPSALLGTFPKITAPKPPSFELFAVNVGLSSSDKLELFSALPGCLRIDLNRGIDLPIRPYSGTRDRERDLALCEIRDKRMKDDRIARILQELDLHLEDGFPDFVHSYRERARELGELIARGIAQGVLNKDRELCQHAKLVQDLGFCVYNAQSLALLRTPLALMLGSADQLAELYGEEDSWIEAKEARRLRDTILTTYAFYVFSETFAEQFQVQDLGDLVSRGETMEDTPDFSEMP